MGEESAAMMSVVAATTVHNSVDTELLAVRLIDEIKVESTFETFAYMRIRILIQPWLLRYFLVTGRNYIGDFAGNGACSAAEES